MASPYKRGSSGYSEADENAANRYARLENRISSDALRRKNAGDKDIVMSRSEVDARTRSAKQQYLNNLSSESGRELNRKNEQFMRTTDLPTANSRAQYNSEKEAGDPYATSMSYEEWKNLD